MSSNWDYAQLARIASEHGGPQALLDHVKATVKFEGRVQGLVVGAIGGALVSWGYAYVKTRKERAAIAERAILRGIQASSEGDDPASGDIEDL